MNITILLTGKTSERHISDGMRVYLDRLSRYAKVLVSELKAGNGNEKESIKKESETILKRVSEKDFLVLLDKKGREITSEGFAGFIANHQNISTKSLVFAIGGAYGFSEEVYKRANSKIALSKMTFPHQLVRLIFLEQLYRAFTILKGEKYHH